MTRTAVTRTAVTRAAALALSLVTATALAGCSAGTLDERLAVPTATTATTAGPSDTPSDTPGVTAPAPSEPRASGTATPSGSGGAAASVRASARPGSPGRSGTAAAGGGPAGTGGASGSGESGGTPTGTWWRPAAGSTWQVQYSGPLDTSVAAQVYDLDGSGTTAAQVAQLHAAGRRVICYIDAGSSESYRSDAGRFPASVLGAVMDGWPDERWLDIRQTAVLLPLMAARIDECRAKGFDAVDPDNLNGYTNDTGFPLTAADQLRYNRAIADLAHRRGLAVGLKNDIEQVDALAAAFDFAVNEQCLQYSECGSYRPFVAAGKPVYSIEYQGTAATVCAAARRYGLTTLIKDLALGAAGQAC